MAASGPRKKLIEVSIPLEAINVASAREKSIRHGHPSTLHLWWARRPLAACRAVLFAQLVDDPSSWPDRFPTEEAQDNERRRLHRIIEDMVPWEALNNETIMNAARWEIARSVAWGLGDEPPPQGDGQAILEYLQTKAPPVYDPFSGGGSIPLEAQRLGLRAYGSDLNPVAVLVGKALVEIPPKFAGRPPVNPDARTAAKHGELRGWRGAQGLAEDIRHYGQWMRDEAERRIGHLYPKAKLQDGSLATVIAWLWARTVRSPDPAAKGAMVPLVSSFLLTGKEGRKAWIEPIIDPSAPDGYRFEVRTGALSKIDEARIRKGTKEGRGSFRCILTGAAIDLEWIRSEANFNGLGRRLIAIVVEVRNRQEFVSPTVDQQEMADSAHPEWSPDLVVTNPCHDVDRLPMYGMKTWGDAFSDRQKLALNTISNLIPEVILRVQGDCKAAGMAKVASDVFAQSIATYMGLAVGRSANYWSNFTPWADNFILQTFGRQTIQMVWDYAEANPFSKSTGNLGGAIDWIANAVSQSAPASGFGSIQQIDARVVDIQPEGVISTDPPYYDNIQYSEISDYFYVWLRKALAPIWPDLFRRLSTPKEEELVAAPHRHGGRVSAENAFMTGMGEVLTHLRRSASREYPLAIYYAYKQAEAAEGGTTSAGWASFLQAVINGGLAIDGTWPIRTERSQGLKSSSNALASSVVLVCRKRSADADIVTRADFIRLLKRELPDAIDDIRKAGVGPVDMQQSVIGPGMGVFSRHAKVLEDDDSAMPVKTALSLINRVWEEIENELDGAFDPETQVALAWFGTYGFDAKPSGELIMLATAKNISTDALFASGVFQDLHGRAALTPRGELPKNWLPSADKRLTVWECVQHTARVLNAEEGGGAAAGRLVADMGPKAADARALAYRLFEIATQKGWSAEALVYNELAQEWPKLEDVAASSAGEPQLNLL